MSNNVILDNKKLHDLIVSKDLLVTDGRKITREIEALDIKIRRYENKEKQITSKVVAPKELTDKGDAMMKELVKLDAELNKIANEVTQYKLDQIPKDMKEKHKELMKEKEVLERERNKIALKIQKIKDKIIPIVQKQVKPLLQPYDDIETAKAKDGVVTVSTFNRLEDFKAKFRQ